MVTGAEQTVFNDQTATHIEADGRLHSDERDRKFEEAQEARRTTFDQGECERDDGFLTRQRSFNTLVDMRQERFRKAESSLQQLFDHHQKNRDRVGNARRHYFGAFVLRNQADFEQDIHWFSEKFTSEEKTLMTVCTMQKFTLSGLFVDMQEEVRHMIRNPFAAQGVLQEQETGDSGSKRAPEQDMLEVKSGPSLCSLDSTKPFRQKVFDMVEQDSWEYGRIQQKVGPVSTHVMNSCKLSSNHSDIHRTLLRTFTFPTLFSMFILLSNL